MYVETVANRASLPAILLRESWREDGKVHKRTLLNLSTWDPAHVEGLRAVLKGGTVIPHGQDAIRIERSLPHGHVAAALGTAPHRPRPPARPRRQPLPRPGAGADRQPDPRSRLQARHRSGAVAGHRDLQPRREARPR